MKINSSRMAAPLIPGDKFLSQKANRPDWDKKKKKKKGAHPGQIIASSVSPSAWITFSVHTAREEVIRSSIVPRTDRRLTNYEDRMTHPSRACVCDMAQHVSESLISPMQIHGLSCAGYVFFFLKTNARSSMNEDLQAATAALWRAPALSNALPGRLFLETGLQLVLAVAN